MNIFIFFSIILVFNYIYILNFRYVVNFINLYDKPNHVKIHKEQIPCHGGFIYFANILLFIVFIFFSNDVNFVDKDFFSSKRNGISFFLIAFCFFLLGYLDDKYNISPNKKLILQLLFVTLAILIDEDLIIQTLRFSNNFEIPLFKLSIFFTILCFLIFINSVNMFDGVNNQSSMYVFILCFYILLKIPNFYFIYIFLIANLVFFYFNYQNKLFLGDNGSLLIGYIFANLITKVYNLESNFFADEIVIIMFFPVMDLLRLFIKRIILNTHPFEGDKTHIHHILSERFKNKYTVMIIPFLISLSLILYQFNFILALMSITFFYFGIILLFSKKTN